MTTMSESAVSRYSFVPRMFGSKPSTGADSRMSRAIPWGSPSMMSMVTTSSARPFCTTRMAVVAPTNPEPTTVTRIAPSEVSSLAQAARAQSYGVDAEANEARPAERRNRFAMVRPCT